MIYDLGEVAYQQYQIWQLEDVDNKTVQFSTNISLVFFSKFRFLELFINKTMKVSRDILEISFNENCNFQLFW